MNFYKYHIMSALLRCLDLPSVINLFGYYFNKFFIPEFNFFYPINIDIEPTIKCNINCEFCQSSTLKRNKNSICLSEFKKIINSIPHTVKINIQGMGEPLLNSDIFDMISYAKMKKNYVMITTNGTLLSEKTSEKIISSGLDRLIISFDSAEKESYEMIRNGANFDKVVNNISNFMRMRDSRKKPFVSLWMLGQKKTISNLKEMIHIAKEMNVDALVLQLNIADWGKKTWVKAAERLKLDEKDSIHIKQAMIEAKKKRLLFFVNDQYTLFKKNKKKKCVWPWGGTYVSSDGYVVPCCLIADPNIYNFGNIFNQDFDQIWNNEKYKKFRRNIKKNKIPSFCKSCYYEKQVGQDENITVTEKLTPTNCV